MGSGDAVGHAAQTPQSSYADEEAREAAQSAALQAHAAAALERLQQHASWRPLLNSLREFAKVRCVPLGLASLCVHCVLSCSVDCRVHTFICESRKLRSAAAWPWHAVRASARTLLCVCVRVHLRVRGRISGQLKDFLLRVTDWLFKHPVVRQVAKESLPGDLSVSPEDVSAAVVDYARNEIER
jgi:hypothetical protein